MTHGGATGAASAAPYGPAWRSHSSSSTVSTPSSRDLVSFDPAPGPATTRSVLAEIEPDNLGAQPLGEGLGLVAGSARGKENARRRVMLANACMQCATTPQGSWLRAAFDDLRDYVGASSCPHGWIPAFAGMTGVSATLDASSRKFYR
jgi:hypothetical protein